jgi:nucleoside-diphosphate-sugar epimerase
MKKVLVLGASGIVAPHVTPGLKDDYDLRLTDITPHPQGEPITAVDVTNYQQVLAASRGMDAMINCTVVRDDPVQSFHVNVKGAFHAMKAAAACGIKKVIHTGPQSVRYLFDHDFDVGEIPQAPGTEYYMCTKHLSEEICRIYAREHGIQTICFLFNGLGAKPTAPVVKRDFHPFCIVWEDLSHALRLALEVESVPDNFQLFNLLSYLGHGVFSIDKAKRMLGYEPLEKLETYFRRTP